MNSIEMEEKEPEGLMEPSGKKFRIQSKNIWLTYRSHLPKEEFKEWIFEKAKAYDTKECHIAHETSTKLVQYEHSHVLLMFDKIFQTTNCRYFDWGKEETIHPNIKYIKTQKHLDHIYEYICKQDHSLDFLKERIKKKFEGVKEAWNCERESEALEKCATKWSDVPGIIAAMKHKPKEKKAVKQLLEELNPWQKALEKKLLKEPHPRKIIWIWDRIGQTGKNAFLRYWAETQGCLFLTALGGAYHSATLVADSLGNGSWDGKTIIINLTRDNQEKQIYEPIEQMKDGIMTALKWGKGSCMWDMPHVVVFANFAPDVNKMSKDRWDIWDISKFSYSKRKYAPIMVRQFETDGSQKMIRLKEVDEFKDQGSEETSENEE